MESNKDDLKTQFVTREGCYRLLNLSEYSRPNRVGYQSNQNSPQVRVSFVSLPQSQTQISVAQQQQKPIEKGSSSANNNGNSSNPTTNGPIPSSNSLSSSATTATVTSLTNGLQQEHNYLNQNNVPNGDWICFNFGKELYTYSYRGVRKAADLSKPIDKKLYKGTNPSCHDFNQTTATCDGAPLLVGFTTGQIQLVYPGRREQGKLYNEERLIDKTKVTCLKWLPNSSTLFLAAHASGHLYLYNEELPCSPTTPVYQQFKCGDGYNILTCKSKSTRNPIYKWSFGINCTVINGNNSSSSSSSSSSTISSSSSSYSCASDNCSINEFCFSPDGVNLAIVSQDGFLRVFLYDTMELVGIARSYFGGFLCVCWSPDGKYIVVGGEDDLVTVYSFTERRVVARGHGHRSWVSVVAFDPYTTFSSWDTNDFSDDENQYEISSNSNNKRVRSSSIRDSTLAPDKLICYRLGSVSQDTQLCLWDITEDVLRPHHRVRLSTLDPTQQQHQQKSESIQMNGDCCLVGGSVTVSERPSPTFIIKDNTTVDNSLSNSHTTKLLNFTKPVNCVGGNSGDENGSSSSSSKKNKSTSVSLGNNCSNSNISATKSSSTNDEKSNNNNHNHSAFNTLTQRFSNFSFGSDKSSKGSKRNYHSTGKGNGIHSVDQKTNADGNSGTSTLRNKSNSSIVTYDAMKLIGTPACPRYDECPVLEPLICKKIAHERLTALIFREDCFLTACQDGFVYTWARPSSSHLATNSPTATHSSTIV
ncbi:CLUMA_CG020702, isoform A [Clunio marinus]|uniref:CLUMA_CG020702, isoform A n=1 Tax=Clunio marinus TaxID=568069 RepID=A0A1J1J7J8_9DIPT|nr:CLUMA_CG020702, isoform A [Clunio marinus]